MKKLLCLLAVCLLAGSAIAEDAKPPVRFAIVGLVHDHAGGFIPRLRGRTDVQLAGIIETNRDLCARYARSFNLDTNLFYSSLEELLAKTNIQAVATFTSTFDHRRVVEMCAPRGIHVMMEKPLAVNMEHARAMEAAAKKGNIHVIVNYETTWYPGNQAAYGIVHDEHAIGDIRKIVVHDGHRGPKEIRCSATFLEWLTDPVLNGGGALNDFGCYGADLITWLMAGQRPTSVFAVTQQIKPDVYPKVEDDATVVVTYPKAQGIIQASWNWPFDRKDLEIYGRTGKVWCPQQPDGESARKIEEDVTPPLHRQARRRPPFLQAAVARRDIQPGGLSSLKVDMIVVEILDAARKSAETGKQNWI